MGNQKKFNDFTLNEEYREKRLISVNDVEQFAAVVGDKNPVHLDPEFAASTIFKGRIVHGAFLVGLISKILGMDFPGPGTIYLSQDCKFLRPVYVDTSVEILIQLVEIDSERQRFKFNTTVFNDEGKACLDGLAYVWFPVP